RAVLADRRLLLDAVLYNVVYPKFERKFDPAIVVAGRDNVLTVFIHVRGGSTSFGNYLEDRLDAFSTYVPGSVTLGVPGSAYSYDASSKMLTFDLGDLNPHDYPGGILGSYQVTVHPTAQGSLKVLDHTTISRDAWNARYRYDATGCA